MFPLKIRFDDVYVVYRFLQVEIEDWNRLVLIFVPDLGEIKQPEIMPCELSLATESFDLSMTTVFRAESQGYRVTFVKDVQSYF